MHAPPCPRPAPPLLPQVLNGLLNGLTPESRQKRALLTAQMAALPDAHAVAGTFAALPRRIGGLGSKLAAAASRRNRCAGLSQSCEPGPPHGSACSRGASDEQEQGERAGEDGEAGQRSGARLPRIISDSAAGEGVKGASSDGVRGEESLPFQLPLQLQGDADTEMRVPRERSRTWVR